MNWLKRLFGIEEKKDSVFKPIFDVLPKKIEEVLNERQKEKALLFYKHHKERIDTWVKTTSKSYEPSEPDDKEDPRIWKPEYWKWFLTNYQQ